MIAIPTHCKAIERAKIHTLSLIVTNMNDTPNISHKNTIAKSEHFRSPLLFIKIPRIFNDPERIKDKLMKCGLKISLII